MQPVRSELVGLSLRPGRFKHAALRQ